MLRHRCPLLRARVASGGGDGGGGSGGGRRPPHEHLVHARPPLRRARCARRPRPPTLRGQRSPPRIGPSDRRRVRRPAARSARPAPPVLLAVRRRCRPHRGIDGQVRLLPAAYRRRRGLHLGIDEQARFTWGLSYSSAPGSRSGAGVHSVAAVANTRGKAVPSPCVVVAPDTRGAEPRLCVMGRGSRDFPIVVTFLRQMSLFPIDATLSDSCHFSQTDVTLSDSCHSFR